MIALSAPPTRLWRYATRSCAPLGTWVSWKLDDVNVKTVADLPPSEIVEISVASDPATVPLIVLPLVGGQNTSVPPAVNSAGVMYCTVTDAASAAPSSTYARPPPPFPMVNV